MTEAEADITLKFTTAPRVRVLEGGRVEFQLKSVHGVLFRVNIKEKTWRKAETFMQQSDYWVAAVMGKLGSPTRVGFEVLAAGLQVYEKKPKQSQSADAAPAGS